MLLGCLFYLCYRCIRQKHSKRRPMPCLHWSIYVLAFISCVSLGVGFYGNRETEKGMDSTLDAVTDAVKTAMRVQRQNQNLATTLNTTVRRQVMQLQQQFTRDREVKRQLSAIQDNVEEVLRASVDVQQLIVGVNFSNLNQYCQYGQQVSFYRRVSIDVALAVFLVLSLSLFIAVMSLSKCLLMMYCVLGIICLVVCWVLVGIHLGTGLMIGDFCVEPNNVTYRLGSEYYQKDVIDYYVICNVKFNPFMESLKQGMVKLNSAHSHSDQLVQLINSRTSDFETRELALSVRHQLNSTFQMLVQVMAHVDCTGLHHNYVTGVHMLCQQTLSGIGLVVVSLAAEALLCTFLVILSTVTARNAVHRSAVHGSNSISSSKRMALKNLANSRVVAGLLRNNRIPDIQRLQKSIKVLKMQSPPAPAPT